MTQLSQKLHIKSSRGSETANIYTTVEECGGSEVLPVVIEGSKAYIPLYESDDIRSTKGRVAKEGKTYGIGATGKPLYNTQSYNRAGTYTFTVPAGCVSIRVTAVGGGGGCAIATVYGDNCKSYAIAGAGKPSGVKDLFMVPGGGGGSAFSDDVGRGWPDIPPDWDKRPSGETSSGEGSGGEGV